MKDGRDLIREAIRVNDAAIDHWRYLISQGEKENKVEGVKENKVDVEMWIDTWSAKIRETEKNNEILKLQLRVLGPCEGC